jgi:ribulose-5-phosphate 4-epimerase/fuculose-1-phosphate aldolase
LAAAASIIRPHCRSAIRSEEEIDMSPSPALASVSQESRYDDAEWELRCDLAAAYRLIARFGMDDLIYTHLSVRLPGPTHRFLLNPYGLMFDEITASSLVTVDPEGHAIELDETASVNPAGFTIHSALHMNRDDAHCVIHLHTVDGVAVSAQADGLLPLDQHAMVICGDTAYHDYEGIALDLEERERLVEDIGKDKHAMLLRNHGTLTLGKTCADAFLRMYYLERACSMQIAALAGGAKPNWPNQGVAEKTAGQGTMIFEGIVGPLAWPALLRKLDRIDPSYKH